MDVFEYDLIALIFLFFGVYVFIKGRLDVTLSVGPGGQNTVVDANSPFTKSKQVHLGVISCRILGLSLIGFSYLIYAYVKGDLLFTL